MGVVSDWLYKGADAGTKAATQNQVKNLGWGQIAKNVWNDKAGFDKNYKGAGATNRANYTWQGLKSLFGGKTAGNIAGGTPASRQLFEKALQSPVGKYLPAAGGIMRTALSWPMTLAASGPYAMYQMNKPSTPAGYDYVKNFDKGAITGIMDETSTAADIENFSRGMMEADKNYKGTVYPADNTTLEEEFNPTKYLASEDIARRNIGVPQDGRWSGIMRNVARGPLFQSGANVGATLSGGNPLVALAGAIGSQFLPLDRRPSNLDYQYVNQPGGISVVDNKIRGGVLEGKNFASGWGSNNLGTMYENYIDTMEGRGMVKDEFGNLVFDEDELTEAQNQKLRDAKKQLNAYLTTGRKMRGYETPDGKQMTAREFAHNYNQGIGQFAMPTTDSTGKTLDYTGESDTYAGGENTASAQETGNYDDPYDPGYAD